MSNFKKSLVFVFILSLIITSFVNVLKVEAVDACPGVATVTYSGKVYNTVQIGTQCWLKEDLNVGTMISSTEANQVNQTNNNVIEKYCYNNNTAKCDVYGGLYQWAEAVQYYGGVTNNTHWNTTDPTVPVQGICPVGWHIPTISEVYTANTTVNNLFNYLGGQLVSGKKLKEEGNSHWFISGSNSLGTNSSGFTGLPNGHYYHGKFENLNAYGYHWTVTGSVISGISYPYAAHVYGAAYNSAQGALGNVEKVAGYPIRCIKDVSSSVASVSISSSSSSVNTGTSVTFTATPTNGGSTPTYQWKKNDVVVSGATNSTYTYVPVNGDVVKVVMTSSMSGVTGSPATSNSITMTVNTPNIVASVSVNVPSSTVTTGTSLTFTAIPTNGGTNPTYQWKKNGVNISGATSKTYTYVPVNGDAISVVMTSSLSNATGSPATSNVITVQTQTSAPGAPTNLKLNPVPNSDGSYNLNKVNLTWTAPANNGGSPITGYKIDYRIKGATSWTTLTSTTTTKTIDVTAGVEYEFVVNAVNVIGASSNGPMVASPSKMTGITVTPNGAGKLLVSWTTPNNGGSDIIQYRLRYLEQGVTPLPNNWGTLMTITDPTATSAEITGLTTGKSYQVRIRAVNGVFGPWSDDTTAVQVSLIDSKSLLGSSITGFDALTSGNNSVKPVTSGLTNKFTTNLSYGKKHNDVKQLQQFLNNKGYYVSLSGKETTYFGKATKQALIKFQQDNNITPASGNLGIKTRTLINEMINGDM